MGRINVEDKLFKDGRYIDLLLKVGCKHKALGLVCGAWILAQKHWLTHGCIPKKAWSTDFDVLIDVQLAERLADGSVYIKGSKSAFAWLEQRSEAGKKSRNKKDSKASNAIQRKSKLTVVEQSFDSVERDETKRNGDERDETGLNGSNPPTPTPTPTHPHNSNSSSSSDSSNTSSRKATKKDPADIELNRKIWQSYFTAYRSRYGVDPVRNGQINAQVAQLGKRLGEDAIEVVKFYLTHMDGFYLKNCHALRFCLKDAESLHSQWQRGVKVTSTKVKAFEKQATFAETLQDIRENGI